MSPSVKGSAAEEGGSDFGRTLLFGDLRGKRDERTSARGKKGKHDREGRLRERKARTIWAESFSKPYRRKTGVTRRRGKAQSLRDRKKKERTPPRTKETQRGGERTSSSRLRFRKRARGGRGRKKERGRLGPNAKRPRCAIIQRKRREKQSDQSGRENW